MSGRYRLKLLKKKKKKSKFINDQQFRGKKNAETREVTSWTLTSYKCNALCF